jgi:hypothetical protein
MTNSTDNLIGELETLIKKLQGIRVNEEQYNKLYSLGSSLITDVLHPAMVIKE